MIFAFEQRAAFVLLRPKNNGAEELLLRRE